LKILVSVVRFRPRAPLKSLNSFMFSFLIFEILLRFDGILEGFDNFSVSFDFLFPNIDCARVLLREVGVAGVVQSHGR
jgi:hypothetical protein